MDDKTFIASYAAQEMQRINERLKAMVQSEVAPSEEERDAVVEDINVTLQRLHSALSMITPEMLAQLEDEHDKKPQ